MPAVEKKEPVNKEALTAVNAALEALAESEKVDENELESISVTVEKMNESTQRAILDLPVMQRLIEKAQAATEGSARPGTIKKVGLFEMKVPYTLESLYEIWGVEERYVYNKLFGNEMPVVTPGGWQFRLTDGMVYDTPRGTPPEKIPEEHGYQLPKIVIQILEDSRAARRATRKETEREAGFGMGVKFLQSGWAGKETVITEGVPADKVDPE